MSESCRETYAGRVAAIVEGVFGALRAKRATRHMKAWQAQRDSAAELLTLALSYSGTASNEIVLKGGEALFAKITGASLIEERQGAGHWEGRSSGFSVPIGSIGGRSIRYRVGSTRGHFVQGSPVPTAIDEGTLFVTNQRVVFQGTRQTRECRFDKMVGFQHTKDGSTVFSVSNRQKTTVVQFGRQLSGWFDFYLDLALAHYRGDVAALVAQLQHDLDAIDAARPSSLESHSSDS